MRSLWATGSAPTTVVAGFPMHRIQDIDPLDDTRRKLEAAGPLRGEVLDTATGLGYTAIHAARSAASVVTLEVDPAAIDLARSNPWSEELFSDPKVSQRIGDAAELVARLGTGRFSAVIHDPPRSSWPGSSIRASSTGNSIASWREAEDSSTTSATRRARAAGAPRRVSCAG